MTDYNCSAKAVFNSLSRLRATAPSQGSRRIRSQFSGKTAEIIGNTVGANCVRPREADRISMQFHRRERCPHRSGKTQNITARFLCGTGDPSPTVAARNEQIRNKSVGFGVPDEPIWRRRIMLHIAVGRCGHRPLQIKK